MQADEMSQVHQAGGRHGSSCRLTAPLWIFFAKGTGKETRQPAGPNFSGGPTACVKNKVEIRLLW